MAELSNANQQKVLKCKKIELTLDEYYEQHVRTDNPNLDSAQSNVMELTLDEYYEKFVQPKEQLQTVKKEEDPRRSQYQRTHYFGPNYLKRLKRQPKQ